MSYFEPSRRRFERQRTSAPSPILEWLFDLPRWWRAVLPIGLVLYAGGALALCGIALPIAIAIGTAATLLLATLLAFYRLEWRWLSALCGMLAIVIGALVLALPAFVYFAMALWLLISLPLWLFRA